MIIFVYLLRNITFCLTAYRSKYRGKMRKLIALIFQDKWFNLAVVALFVSLIVSLFLKTDSTAEWIASAVGVGILGFMILRALFLAWSMRKSVLHKEEKPNRVRSLYRIQDALFLLFLLCSVLLLIWKYI